MDPAIIETYADSLQRCLEQPRFMERFYELFLASSDEVRQKFEHTNFAHQMRALKKSLLDASWIHSASPEARELLENVARTHSRKEKDIPPRLYKLWLNSLIQTVQETDPKFSPQVESAYRSVLAQVIDFMKSQY